MKVDYYRNHEPCREGIIDETNETACSRCPWLLKAGEVNERENFSRRAGSAVTRNDACLNAAQPCPIPPTFWLSIIQADALAVIATNSFC
jgi:hypothetical protein